MLGCPSFDFKPKNRYLFTTVPKGSKGRKPMKFNVDHVQHKTLFSDIIRRHGGKVQTLIDDETIELFDSRSPLLTLISREVYDEQWVEACALSGQLHELENFRLRRADSFMQSKSTETATNPVFTGPLGALQNRRKERDSENIPSDRNAEPKFQVIKEGYRSCKSLSQSTSRAKKFYQTVLDMLTRLWASLSGNSSK
mmetsp:Transcript_5043/g.15127  ORF Transcript_5043/g.15127 Transcript_5043/m.15127 type:complete len:197 (+) Transcript_5043:21-611(+)